MLLKQFRSNILIQFLVRFNETVEVIAVLLTVSINFNVGILMFMNGFGSILV